MKQKWINVVLAIAVIASIGISVFSILGSKGGNKIAFMDTNRVLTGFKEAHKVNEMLRGEDEKWRKGLKALEDSLKSFMDTMSVHYDKAPVEKKRQLQDELAAKNQQINNFTAVNTRRLQDMQVKSMEKVYEKVNAFLKEYGKKGNYQIIFGTSGGSIVYGEGTPLDITNEIIELLNARYQ